MPQVSSASKTVSGLSPEKAKSPWGVSPVEEFCWFIDFHNIALSVLSTDTE